MKLLRSIHKATISTLTLPPHHTTNSYLVGGDGEAVLIDPIYRPGNDLDACLQENHVRRIRYAAVTHRRPPGLPEPVDLPSRRGRRPCR
jgi:glyoxylase-like metal-dependent hydrolase (beta-lactamase superfamily II)